MDKKITYSEAVERLQQIMNEIQSGAVDIDKLTKELAEAQNLISFCRSRLYKVEEEVKSIIDGLSNE